jgi:hypothetical protein
MRKLAAFAIVALTLTVHAALPSQERAKIEALIAAVEKLPDAVFVRNGKAHSPATAAKFLRAKWNDRAKDILTAEDFIDKVATRSSTTGRAYLVRYKDGREVASAVFFRAELAKR